MSRGRTVVSVAGVLLCGVLVVVVMTVCSSQSADAEYPGVHWVDLSLDQALSKAKREKARVFVEFTADWCPSCKQLDEEVLSTAAGAELTAKLIPIRLDFDDEANRRAVERYVVLGLPSVVVLTPEGQQFGRVMGYEDRDDWLTKARAAVVSDNPLPALRSAQAAQPENIEALLRLGKALLVRGETDEGEAMLERVIWMASSGDQAAGEAAAEALFVLGRYYQRVKRDPATARHVWRELAARYPRSEWAGGSWWWYAKAQAELDRHQVGREALRSRARAEPNSVDALVEWGEFLVRYSLDDDRDEVRAALSKRLSSKVTAEQRDELEELSTKLTPQKGR